MLQNLWYGPRASQIVIYVETGIMKALKCKTLGKFGSILNFVVRCNTWYILSMHIQMACTCHY